MSLQLLLRPLLFSRLGFEGLKSEAKIGNENHFTLERKKWTFGLILDY